MCVWQCVGWVTVSFVPLFPCGLGHGMSNNSRVCIALAFHWQCLLMRTRSGSMTWEGIVVALNVHAVLNEQKGECPGMRAFPLPLCHRDTFVT